MPQRNEYEIRSMERIRWLIDTYCEGSQAAFCERTGLHKSTVSKIVNNLHTPSKASAEKIASVFMVSQEWVNGYDVPMKKTAAVSERTASLPVYTRLPAHLPLDQVIDINGSVEYEKDKISQGETCFAYAVCDDSMQPRIQEGDIVIASATEKPVSGDLVLASVDDRDAILRRLTIYENSIALFADNPAIPPEYIAENEKARLRIIGKIKELRAAF